jgi:hypothetical protein
MPHLPSSKDHHKIRDRVPRYPPYTPPFAALPPSHTPPPHSHASPVRYPHRAQAPLHHPTREPQQRAPPAAPPTRANRRPQRRDRHRQHHQRRHDICQPYPETTLHRLRAPRPRHSPDTDCVYTRHQVSTVPRALTYAEQQARGGGEGAGRHRRCPVTVPARSSPQLRCYLPVACAATVPRPAQRLRGSEHARICNLSVSAAQQQLRPTAS